jgi:hypothetical protein
MMTAGVGYWTWAIFNAAIGVFELYCFHRRNMGALTPLPLSNVSATPFAVGHWDLFGKLWNEYALADPRYVLPDSQYVWLFELLNVFLAAVFLVAMWVKARIGVLKLILVVQIYSCLFYFMTFLDDDLAQRASERLLEPKWRDLYFAISSLWIIVPLALVLQ